MSLQVAGAHFLRGREIVLCLFTYIATDKPFS
jgi:hypothetical protein